MSIITKSFGVISQGFSASKGKTAEKVGKGITKNLDSDNLKKAVAKLKQPTEDILCKTTKLKNGFTMSLSQESKYPFIKNMQFFKDGARHGLVSSRMEEPTKKVVYAGLEDGNRSKITTMFDNENNPIK